MHLAVLGAPRELPSRTHRDRVHDRRSTRRLASMRTSSPLAPPATRRPRSCDVHRDRISSTPSATTGPSYYGPAPTNATLMDAAVFAYASKILGARPEADLQAYAADLEARAVQAWDWAEANPSVLYYNNDESRQPGSSGLGAGQQETDDAGRRFSKFQAAMYLYEMTGEAAYRTFVESTYTEIVPSYGPDQWNMEPQDALLYSTRLEGISDSVKSAIVDQFVTNVTNNP